MAYQEKLEQTMFIVLGFMYEERPVKDIETYRQYIPDDLQEYFNDAVDSLQREEFIGGKDMRTQIDAYDRLMDSYMTQIGRDWYSANKPQEKWKSTIKIILDIIKTFK